MLQGISEWFKLVQINPGREQAKYVSMYVFIINSVAPGRFTEPVKKSVLFTAQGTPDLSVIFTVSYYST